MKYYIIGNGFDISHGLKTSYGDFLDFYKKSNFLTDEEHELWSDFENNFSLHVSNVLDETVVDAEEIRDEIYVEDYYDVISPNGDNCQPYFSFLTSFKEDEIKKFTLEFKKYLLSLDYSRVEKKFDLEENSAIISFNYTLYAKSLYNIKSFSNIHGHVNDKILFGYNSFVNKAVSFSLIPEIDEIEYDGSDPGDFLAELQSYDRSEDVHGTLDKADEIAYDCMESIKGVTDKYDKALSECRQLIELEFYNAVKQGDEVAIIGHSLGEADSDFFNKLNTKCVELNVPIKCYYYKDSTPLQAIISNYKWNFDLNNVEEVYIKSSQRKC